MGYILRLPPNRVRRNYKGGAGIDWLHGKKSGVDNDMPEEWIASLVEAKNPGMEVIPDEGLGFCVNDGQKVLLRDMIQSSPEFYLGKRHLEEKGMDLGFLFKILDSSMRLHVQAHPTAEFSRTYLDSPYGKLECYYILHVRPGIKPYIRLGFQHAPSREEWKRIIVEQDMSAMDGCFEPVPIEEGQVWFIPGGMPHAIGEGILILEIMEPSDWVVRCEFERNGVVVPPQGRFMERGLDFCLGIFDYGQYSLEDIHKKSRVHPHVVREGDGYCLEQLIDKTITSCFEVKRLRLEGSGVRLDGGVVQTGVVVKGNVTIRCEGQEETFRCGDSFLVAAAAGSVEVSAEAGTEGEICFVIPGYREEISNL